MSTFSAFAYGLWVPLSPQELVENSSTVFVGNITDIGEVERQYQSQIARDGTVKETVGPETIILDEYTVKVEEFLKNPQETETMRVLRATVSGVPGGLSKISGFEIGDRVLFYLPKDEKQTHFPGQYLPESFKIPQECDAKTVMSQPKIELTNSFDIMQEGVAKKDNFTAGVPMKFVYSKDMGELGGQSMEVTVSLRPYGEDEIVFEKNIHAESEPCAWIASAEWEFTPKEGEYRMYLNIRENGGNGVSTSYTGFSAISKLKSTSPSNQFNSGVPLNEIQCKENLVLIQKYDGTPACVSPETKQKLTERGWAKIQKNNEFIEPVGYPGDFEFTYSSGVGGKNSYNSKNEVHVTDMVCDDPLVTHVSLTHTEKAIIWKTVYENNFFHMSDFTQNCYSDGNCMVVEPESITTLFVVAEGIKHSVTHKSSYIGTDDASLLQFNRIIELINQTLENKEEMKSLPKPKCAYL